jgi:hypothetical protein
VKTSRHYRAKAAEMIRFAEAAKWPDTRDHWLTLSAAWADLAGRTEREDRFLRSYAPSRHAMPGFTPSA